MLNFLILWKPLYCSSFELIPLLLDFLCERHSHKFLVFFGKFLNAKRRVEHQRRNKISCLHFNQFWKQRYSITSMFLKNVMVNKLSIFSMFTNYFAIHTLHNMKFAVKTRKNQESKGIRQ